MRRNHSLLPYYECNTLYHVHKFNSTSSKLLEKLGSEHCEQPAGYILGVCQPHLPFLVGSGGQAVGSEQPAGYLLGIGQLHLPLLQDPHRPRHEQEGAGLCHRLPINRYVEWLLVKSTYWKKEANKRHFKLFTCCFTFWGLLVQFAFLWGKSIKQRKYHLIGYCINHLGLPFTVYIQISRARNNSRNRQISYRYLIL